MFKKSRSYERLRRNSKKIDYSSLGLLNTHELLDTCKSLESIGSNILIEQENTWWLKCMALWIVACGQNTKYFHNFSNYQNNLNTI